MLLNSADLDKAARDARMSEIPSKSFNKYPNLE
jgi:hypothetical protein